MQHQPLLWQSLWINDKRKQANRQGRYFENYTLAMLKTLTTNWTAWYCEYCTH